MNKVIETRLRKLEAASPERQTHVFVIEGATAVERRAQIDELIRSGKAKASDRFICTGVTRSREFLGPTWPGCEADLTAGANGP